MSAEQVVLEEEIDPNYEPTNEEIEEYATWLGMDLQNDNELFWIAKEGLKAPLPPDWKPCKSPEGEIYYFNFSNGESVWDHPCDEYYKKLYKDEKDALGQRKKRDAEDKLKKKEDKRKRKEAERAQQAAQAQTAAASGGGATLGGLAPLSMTMGGSKALPAPKPKAAAIASSSKPPLGSAVKEQTKHSVGQNNESSAVKSESKRNLSGAGSQGAALGPSAVHTAAKKKIDEAFEQKRQAYEKELENKLEEWELIETSKREEEQRDEVQRLKRKLSLKVEDERKQLEQLHIEIKTLSAAKASEQAKLIEGIRNERESQKKKELQAQLYEMKQEYERKTMEQLDSIRTNAKVQVENKTRETISDLKDERKNSLQDKRKLLGFELEKIRQDCSKEEVDFKKMEEQARSAAATSGNGNVEAQRAKHNAEIKEQVDAEHQRMSDTLTTKLEVQEMRNQQAFQARLTRLSMESDFQAAVKLDALDTAMKAELEAEVVALKQELEEGLERAADRTKISVEPYLREEEEKLAQELESMLDSKSAESEKTCNGALTASSSDSELERLHNEKVKTLNIQFDRELKRCQEEVEAFNLESAHQATTQKSAKKVQFFQNKLEDVRLSIDQANDLDLRDRKQIINDAHKQKTADLDRKIDRETRMLLDEQDREHIDQLAVLVRDADNEIVKRNDQLSDKLSEEFNTALESVRQEQQLVQEKERARVLEAYKLETGAVEEPAEDMATAEQHQTLRENCAVISWQALAKKVVMQDKSKSCRDDRAHATKLRLKLKERRAARKAQINAYGRIDLSSENTCLQNELDALQSQHSTEVADARQQHVETVAGVRANTEQVRGVLGSAAADDLATMKRRYVDEQWQEWLSSEADSRAQEERKLRVEIDEAMARTRTQLADAQSRLHQVKNQASSNLASGATSDLEVQLESAKRCAALDTKHRDSLRMLVSSLKSEQEQLVNELGQAGASIVPQPRKAWAGVPIQADVQKLYTAPQELKYCAGLAGDYSDDEIGSADSTDSSLLIFAALRPLEETELSVSYYGGDNGDQSSIYVTDVEVQRERKRLARADEFISAQQVELRERKAKLLQIRAGWRRDFNAVLAREQASVCPDHFRTSTSRHI
jgi:hypothetical protein